MSQTIEKIENQNATIAGLKELLSDGEGRRLLEMALKQSQRVEKVPAHTPEQIKTFYMMSEKESVTYVRIDPKTKQPLSEAKEFIWKILAPINSLVGACTIKEFGLPRGEIRVQFQIQKYYRNRMVLRAKDERADPALPLASGDGVETNEPWCEREPDGAIIETGERIIDASEFMEQFKAE